MKSTENDLKNLAWNREPVQQMIQVLKGSQFAWMVKQSYLEEHLQDLEKAHSSARAYVPRSQPYEFFWGS